MTIVSNLISLTANDIIAVFDEDGEQLFVGEVPASDTTGFSTGRFFGTQRKAQPFKLFVNRPTKSFTHPLENNTTITDHRIILPIEITLKFLIIDDRLSEIYQQIQDTFEIGQTVTVKTKARVYDNLFVSAMPHTEDPSKFDTLEVDVTFTEIQNESGTEAFNPANNELSDTVGRGEINTQVQ